VNEKVDAGVICNRKEGDSLPFDLSIRKKPRASQAGGSHAVARAAALERRRRILNKAHPFGTGDRGEIQPSAYIIVVLN
jgi:hypothetical protein